MNNIELRDSIAKEIYLNFIDKSFAEDRLNGDLVKGIASMSLDIAEAFMEEKLKRDNGTRSYIGKQE